MSRLTQAFGFLAMDVRDNNKLFAQHNFTSFTISEEMKSIRRKLKLQETKDKKTTKVLLTKNN